MNSRVLLTRSFPLECKETLLLWLVKHNPNQTSHPVLLADNSLMHLGIRWTDEPGQEFSGPLIGKKVVYAFCLPGTELERG